MDRMTDRETDRPHELHVYVGQARPNDKTQTLTCELANDYTS